MRVRPKTPISTQALINRIVNKVAHMNLLPRVDITILSWDRIRETIDAIDSALNQQSINSKIIVIDQGSQPEALAKLQQHCSTNEKVTLVCNEKNVGVPGGRNQAAQLGDGDYIVALDNDAEFIDEHQLARACQIMNTKETLGVLAFRILRYGTDEDDVTSWPYHESLTTWSHKEFYTDRFVGAGHMIRRCAFEQVGCYDERLFFLHEEVDLSKKMINAHYKILYTPEVIIGHKVSAEHRVAWSDDRWMFDVRNKTYLHIKFKTFIPTALFHTGLMVWRGLRSGLIKATFRGLYQAAKLVPHAVSSWKKNPYLSSDEKARAYFDACSPTSNMSLYERIKMRLTTATTVVVKDKR